jgi:dienelactone hydrolase
MGGRGHAVLLYHGLRADSASLEREGKWLASAGFTAILPDAPHHGARHSDVVGHMPDALSLDGHRILLRILRDARDEIPRLVDYALSQGHEKVAIAGVSMGGFIALAAGAADPRIAAIVSILGTPDWTPREGHIPDDLQEAVVQSPHLQPDRFVPRPLLFLNASHDESVRPGPARELVARLRPLYEKTGPTAIARLIHREYDCSHAVPEHDWADMWMTTAGFLGRFLG